jgi:hypothetical protein
VTRGHGQGAIGRVEHGADDQSFLEDQALQRSGREHFDIALQRLPRHPVEHVVFTEAVVPVHLTDGQYLDGVTVG